MEEKRAHQTSQENSMRQHTDGTHATPPQSEPVAETVADDLVNNQADLKQQKEAGSEVQLAKAHAHIAELKEEFLRAKAETENVRRRAQEELVKSHKFAIERFAEHLLPVIDSLDAALSSASEDAAKMRDGVELTLRQLNAALEKGRVIAINPAAGEKFDPHQHQAISTVPAEQEPNTVVTVLQKGYLIADRVLRPALVMVCQAK